MDKKRTLKLVMVTPEMAQRWLDASPGNRVIREGTVAGIARAVTQRLWQPSAAEPLVISNSGGAIEGHHRLLGFIRSGQTVPAWVLFGEDTAPSNTGRPWSLGDTFFARCADDTVLRVVNKQPGRAQQTAAIAAFVYNVLTGAKNPHVDEAIRIVKRYEVPIGWVLDCVSADRFCRRAAVMTALVMAYDHASRQSLRTTKNIASFAEQLKSGERLSAGEPAYILRDYLIGIVTRKRGAGYRPSVGKTDSQWIIFIKTLRASEAHLNGERMRQLRAPDDTRELIDRFLGMATAELVDELGLTTRGAESAA